MALYLLLVKFDENHRLQPYIKALPKNPAGTLGNKDLDAFQVTPTPCLGNESGREK